MHPRNSLTSTFLPLSTKPTTHGLGAPYSVDMNKPWQRPKHDQELCLHATGPHKRKCLIRTIPRQSEWPHVIAPYWAQRSIDPWPRTTPPRPSACFSVSAPRKGQASCCCRTADSVKESGRKRGRQTVKPTLRALAKALRLQHTTHFSDTHTHTHTHVFSGTILSLFEHRAL